MNKEILWRKGLLQNVGSLKMLRMEEKIQFTQIPCKQENSTYLHGFAINMAEFDGFCSALSLKIKKVSYGYSKNPTKKKFQKNRLLHL